MKLATLQRWAAEYAAKLCVTDTVTVRVGCRISEKWEKTHCHVVGTIRGTICLRDLRTPRADWANLTGIRGWRWRVAHEVCHLAVKDHNSPYFHKRMAVLGFAKERRLAQVAGMIRHRHQWRYRSLFLASVVRECRICQAEQVGRVTWGKTIRPEVWARGLG